MLTQYLVPGHFIDQVDPGLRTAGQPVQQEDDPLVRVIRLHQVDMRPGYPLAAAEQGAQRLHRKARVGQPQTVGGGVIGRQRNAVALQGDAGGALGGIHIQVELARGQHLFQRIAGKVQHGGGIDRRHLTEHGYVLDPSRPFFRLGGVHRQRQLRRLHLHHQLGTKAITAVAAAQAGKADAGSGHHRPRHTAQAQLVIARGNFPALFGQLQLGAAAAVGRLFAGAFKQHRGDLLHRGVVVIAHLQLAVLQRPLGGAAPGKKQVGIGMACRFQPGLVAGKRSGDTGLAVCLDLVQRNQRPQLGQCRQAHLGIHPGALAHRGDAVTGLLATERRIDTNHLQGFPGGSAQLPTAEHVGTLGHGEIRRRHRAQLDHGTTTCQGQQQQQQHQTQPWLLPAVSIHRSLPDQFPEHPGGCVAKTACCRHRRGRAG